MSKHARVHIIIFLCTVVQIVSLIADPYHIKVDELLHLSPDNISLQEKTGLPEEVLKSLCEHLYMKEREFVNMVGDQYYIIPKLINENECKIVCEVGVAFGTHAITILDTTNVQKIYGVDPFQHFSNLTYVCWMNFEERIQNILYCLVESRFEQYNDRAVLIRKTSKDAAATFHSKYFDLVYVDANHSYENVMEDLTLWFDKVKHRGILAGDDYGWPSVARAVDEFFGERNIHVNFEGSRTWWVRK